MYLSQTGPVYPDDISLSLALRNWGEGASNAGSPGGHGAQAQTGDATWLHTFYNTDFWTTPGGDFSPTISATTTVEIWGQDYQWASAGLLADVQSWVSNPAGNFGWVILGDEVNLGSAVRFGSGQHPTNPPHLLVTFQAPTPTPTPTPTADISGTVVQCAGATSNPLAGVTMTLTGTSGGSTTTDNSGNYSFTGLASGGTYTVTPTKAARLPGSSGITTSDVIATQRHFLGVTLLTGCRLAAADCATPFGLITTSDVIAIQRFFLGLSTGIGNVGKYSFNPVNLSYSPLTSTQTGQGYDTIVFGDTATPFGNPRPGGPSQDGARNDTSAGEIPATVGAVLLPSTAVDGAITHFTAQVTTTMINADARLVGFQGDFTFDSRVVTFQDPPVQPAGLTGSNWNVSGNVLPGKGPIRTLRISAYSLDFIPLSGTGTLFELRMNRRNKAAQSAQLIWAAPPDNFIFIDADLNTQRPGSAATGSVSPRAN